MTNSASFTDSYVRRVIDDDLDELFGQLPALLLDGPKGVGKTRTAEQRCSSVRRLDRTTEREIVQAEPTVIAHDPRPTLIDEWQRVPDIWDVVRRLVDEDPRGGRFLLTGSPPARGTHSGAGRIASLRMRPLSLWERGVAPSCVSFAKLLDGAHEPLHGRSTVDLGGYVEEIMAGGFPAMRGLTGRALTLQLDSYLERIVDHDLREAGFTVRRPLLVRAWMRACAAATATTASWEKIRDAASTAGGGHAPARTTTIQYTELLTSLRILDPLSAWLPTNNHLGRLSAGPKHHLADPALAVRLLERTRQHLLTGDEGHLAVPRDGTLLGALFESLATLSVRTFAQACDARTYHLRTRDGRREVDLIVEKDSGILAVEVKLAGSVDDGDVRHLHWLRQQIGDDLIDAAILTTGPEAYRRPDGIAVIPLALLGP